MIVAASGLSGVDAMADIRNACVIGWPAGHSRSPLIHNYWIRKYGLAGEYRREAVALRKILPHSCKT